MNRIGINSMNVCFSWNVMLSGFLLFFSMNAFPLSVQQFSEICRSGTVKCSDDPVMHAYVGGALDLLATLQEETGYLEKIYCKAPLALFDVPTIIGFMEERAGVDDQRNAMLLFIDYFEQQGGCGQ